MTDIAHIHRPTLATMKFTASTEGTRYYLCGVHLEIEPERVTYVATDGARMIVRRIKNPEGKVNTLCGNVIVPVDALKRIKIAKGKYVENSTTDLLTWGALHADKLSGESIFLSDRMESKAGFVFLPIDGKFPGWRRVIPRPDPKRVKKEFGEDFVFNAAYLKDFADFSKTLDLGGVLFCPFCDGAPELIGFQNDPDTFGVLMPIRGGAKAPTLPAWMETETETKTAS